jgi:formylglycine-generating enzyme required for sulfatase activity/serine/threonine protein kinase
MDRSIGDEKTISRTLPVVRGDADDSTGDRDTLRPENAPLGRIDQYELIRELGGGGFGTVYLARDTVAGVDVAVKGLPPLVRNNAEELERIRENFALVSRLHHPHIAAALHLHQARAAWYAEERVRQALRVMPGDTLMVMAYAPGVTLAKWRKQFPDGRVPVAQALEVCRQIAAALDYAHGEKVVHRDVKPSNVMVETRGEGRGNKDEGTLNAQRSTLNAEVVVRVLDFGLAAEIRSSMSRVSQEKGDTSGTRPYMAPEQWAGRKQDGRTDQYALAALFYELVSGGVPLASAFDTGDAVIMANAAENKAPEPQAELSKAQNAALLRGLAKGPAQRFASCGELVAALAGTYAKTRRREGKRAFLCLAAAAVLAYGSYRSYASYAIRRAAERAAAAEAEELDAVQREKVAGLTAGAEAALAAGDLEAAGARIAELKSAGGPGSVSAELQKKYEAKAGERETNRRYAAASVAREAAQKLDAGQGFGEWLKALEMTWREAEAARQGQGWGQALSGYDAVLAACKRLEEEEVSRGDARTRRGEAEKAEEAAVRAEAAKDAKEIFEEGVRCAARAAQAFEKGLFADASKAWRETAAAYASAQGRALAVQAYTTAKVNFETVLATNTVLLTTYGGAKWADVKSQQKLAEIGTNDLQAGAEAYRKALEGLSDAVGEAAAVRLRIQIEERVSKADEMIKIIAAAVVSGNWSQATFLLNGLNTSPDELGAESHRLDKIKNELQNRVSKGLADSAEKDARNRAELAYYTWKKKVNELAGRLEGEAPSARGEQAKILLTAVDEALAETSSLDNKRLTAEEAETLLELVSRLRMLKDEIWAEPKVGQQRIVDLGKGVRLALVWCPAGNFTMGSPENEPHRNLTERQHQVCLSKGFWMGKTELTQAQWEAVMGNNPSGFRGPNLPVEMVSWSDCQEFVQKLNSQVAHGGFRLATEAEWEYACRAGTTTPFHYGGMLDSTVANLDGNYPYGSERKKAGCQATVTVGTFQPNAWGLCDMHGNVGEWCSDRFGDYPSVDVVDTVGPNVGAFRVIRGGSWCSPAKNCRAASRSGGGTDYRNDNLGLRIVCDEEWQFLDSGVSQSMDVVYGKDSDTTGKDTNPVRGAQRTLSESRGMQVSSGSENEGSSKRNKVLIWSGGLGANAFVKSTSYRGKKFNFSYIFQTRKQLHGFYIGKVNILGFGDKSYLDVPEKDMKGNGCLSFDGTDFLIEWEKPERPRLTVIEARIYVLE